MCMKTLLCAKPMSQDSFRLSPKIAFHMGEMSKVSFDGQVNSLPVVKFTMNDNQNTVSTDNRHHKKAMQQMRESVHVTAMTFSHLPCLDQFLEKLMAVSSSYVCMQACRVAKIIFLSRSLSYVHADQRKNSLRTFNSWHQWIQANLELSTTNTLILRSRIQKLGKKFCIVCCVFGLFDYLSKTDSKTDGFSFFQELCLYVASLSVARQISLRVVGYHGLYQRKRNPDEELVAQISDEAEEQLKGILTKRGETHHHLWVPSPCLVQLLSGAEQSLRSLTYLVFSWSERIEKHWLHGK